VAAGSLAEAVLEAAKAGDAECVRKALVALARVPGQFQGQGPSEEKGAGRSAEAREVLGSLRPGGPSAWSAALARGHVGVVRVLAGHPGWDAAWPVADGRNAVQLAAWRGQAAVVEALLAGGAGDGGAGAAVNALDATTGMAAVHLAVHVEDEELAAQTLGALVADARVDVNAADARGATALHYAARRPLLEGLGTLLQHPRTDALRAVRRPGAPGCALGGTALEVAAAHGHWEAVELLVRAPGTTREAAAKALRAARAARHVKAQHVLLRPLAPKPRAPVANNPASSDAAAAASTTTSASASASAFAAPVSAAPADDASAGGPVAAVGPKKTIRASLALWASTLALAVTAAAAVGA